MNSRLIVFSVLVALRLYAGAAVPTTNDDDISGSHAMKYDSISAVFHFPVGSSVIIPSLFNNEVAINSIVEGINRCDSLGCHFSVDIIGLASPEGGFRRNMQLARQRSEAARAAIEGRAGADSVKFTLRNGGVNWLGLRSVIEASSIQSRDRILELLSGIRPDGSLPEADVERLRSLEGGGVWNMLNKNYFPNLRVALVTVYSPPRVTPNSELISVYDNPDAETVPADSVAETVEEIAVVVPDTVIPVPVEEPVMQVGSPFRMSLSTNMLYDVALIPNIGAEFYFGRRVSVRAFYANSWWRFGGDAPRHRWQVYGGELGARYWLNPHDVNRGHYLGIFGTVVTYDFSPGKKGVMANEKNPNWGVSVEYGFRLPVAKRMSIDFNVGLGYLGGHYQKYDIMDGHRVWTGTNRRNYFGPTRLGVDLIWLIGNDFFNSKKGGNK